jgi:hypothetical protein
MQEVITEKANQIENFFLLQKLPDRFWGSPNLLFRGYRRLFSGRRGGLGA